MPERVGHHHGHPQLRERSGPRPSRCYPSTTSRVANAVLPTRYGEFELSVYETPGRKQELALTVGEVDDGDPVVVRLHSECLTGDIFGSERCDCGKQLEYSLKLLQELGRGVLLYLRQEGRGIGLLNKMYAYMLQDRGLDTVEANLALGLPEDARDYGVAAEMLRDLGAHQVRLLTNNPAKIEGLERHGVEILERLPLRVPHKASNLEYLKTKQRKMGHLLDTFSDAEYDRPV
ncbi:MAG: GTP cyclohydrolase II [Rubrobacteraceae bacterium]